MRSNRNLWGLFLVIAVLGITGCGPNMRPYGVPFGGSLVGEAAGKAASFTSPRDGTVWVAGPGHPGQDRYIVYSGWIKAGQTITVDPQAHSVTVNGEQQKASLEGGNSYYQIWYQPSQD
jgi:hypothetical protein